MSNEKRFALFVVLMFAWLLGFPYIQKFMGLAPPPQKKAPTPAASKDAGKTGAEDGAAAKAKAALAENPAGDKDSAKSGTAPGAADKAKAESRVTLVDPKELVLGSASDKSPTGYRL